MVIHDAELDSETPSRFGMWLTLLGRIKPCMGQVDAECRSSALAPAPDCYEPGRQGETKL